MATSTASWGRGVERLSKRRYPRLETLIPVTLRLLDRTGRHKITPSMLGVLSEISSSHFAVSVVGPTGRPLARELSHRPKVLVGFLVADLHQKVESLVCEHLFTAPRSGHEDAWAVHLGIPQLPAPLFDEVFEALRRYPPPESDKGGRRAPVLFAAAALTAGVFAFWPAKEAAEVTQDDSERDFAAEISRLEGQLRYSTETVERLTASLEEADKEIEALRKSLSGYELSFTVEGQQPTERRGQRAVAAGPEPSSRALIASEVKIRSISWDDYQSIRAMRGSAPSPRLAYVRGDVELTALSPLRERVTRMLTRLLFAYAQAQEVDLRALGARTLRSADRQVEIEPRETFVVGPKAKPVPDVAYDGTTAQKAPELLKRYARVGVPELWLREDGKLRIYRRQEAGYVRTTASQALPGLDVALLDVYLEREDQTGATQDFMRALAATR